MTKRLSRVPDKKNELEALELAQSFANDTGIDITDSRPCIARLFYEGEVGGGTGRKVSAFKIAQELSLCGLAPVVISKHLEAFGGRCSPPVPKNQLAHVLRSIQKPEYDHKYGCKNLEALCIGDICPFKGKGRSNLTVRQQNGPTAFVSLGWVGYLSGPATKIYLALMSLRIKKGLEPDEFFSFYFGQLERLSGVGRGHMREYLEDLVKVGLIDKIEIGPKWNSGKRQRTKVRLASPVPDPQKLGLKLLKSKDQEL